MNSTNQQRVVFGRLVLVLVSVVLLFVPTHTKAQSGRAPKRNESPSPAVPTVTPTATDIPASKPPKQPGINLIAADYVGAPNVSFETGVAFRSFVERLRESAALNVSPKQDVRRKEAIDLAKGEGGAYVAWLQLEVDLMGRSDVRTDSEKTTITPINPACLMVNYIIFERGSGKILTQGHTYQPGYQDRCAGTVHHPSPYPDRTRFPPRTTPEQALKHAGAEAADRIMTDLDIPLPPQHP
jgi:hypothetical protein